MRRRLAGLVAALAVLTAGAATPAVAEPSETCTGVWVVVDATALDAGVTISCATSHATGTEALRSAGVDIARARNGMLCQLAGRPDTCEVAASGYWSYWQATPSGDSYGKWTYAVLGPDSYTPRGGDAEGWVFGDGSTAPSVLPEHLAEAGEAPSTSPEPSASPSPPASPSEPGATGPLALAAVAGIIVLAGLGVWIARRRAR